MADDRLKKLRKRAKKTERRKLEKAIEENGHHSKERKAR
jgi:hypothetical protein